MGAETFSEMLSRLGDRARARTVGIDDLRAASDGWFYEVLRAPKTGTKFKVNKDGMLPNPPPKFKFSVTAPISIPDSVFFVIFETSGKKECGAAVPRRTFPMSPNVPRTVDIPNDYIIVGPSVCEIDVLNCSTSACKFPLTTTKMHIYYGHKDFGTAHASITMKYTWTTASSGG